MKAKVVGIGLSKTGTTSLHQALCKLGYKSYHDTTPELLYSCQCGDLSKAESILLDYDCVSDFPYPLIYKELYLKYPNAHFILTLRESVDRWLESILNHIRRGVEGGDSRSVFIDMWEKAYDIDASSPDLQKLRSRYSTHVREVLAFMQNRDIRFTTLCFERGDGWKELANFLGRDTFVPESDFPWENHSSEPR